MWEPQRQSIIESSNASSWEDWSQRNTIMYFKMAPAFRVKISNLKNVISHISGGGEIASRQNVQYFWQDFTLLKFRIVEKKPKQRLVAPH